MVTSLASVPHATVSKHTKYTFPNTKNTFPKTNRLLEIPALGAFSITVSQFLHNLPTWALIDGNDVCEDLEQSVYVASLPRWWWLWQLLTLGSDYEHGVFETLPSTGLTWTLNTVHPCKWWNTHFGWNIFNDDCEDFYWFWLERFSEDFYVNWLIDFD